MSETLAPAATTDDIPPGYFVDAQGDVTWGGLPSSAFPGKPTPVLPKEADIRYRNFRFPDAYSAKSSSASRPDPAVPIKIVRDTGAADWTAFVKNFGPADQ